MARRFERNLENPERRIEIEGEFSQTNNIEESLENPYEDDFDKKIDRAKDSRDSAKDYSKVSKRTEFMQSIKVKVEPSKIDTPLSIAYQELDKARQSGVREDIIKAEDRILDLERQEEEKEYNLRIAELNKMQKAARETNDTQGLEQLKKERQSFIREMKYDELSYKIKKLQNSQRLQPSRAKLQQIMELKKELETLEIDEIGK